MPARRFPPPWLIDEHAESFIVKNATGQALRYFFDRRSTLKRNPNAYAALRGSPPDLSSDAHIRLRGARAKEGRSKQQEEDAHERYPPCEFRYGHNQ
jgi:hypothetical protein